MTVLNAVQIFMLLWGFMAVCQTDTNPCNVRCNNVTGAVRKEVMFNCSFSEQCTEGCVKRYKFQYPEKYNDSEICREEFHDPCKKKKTFTCSYTPDTAMKETFRFFVQTTSLGETAEFTVEMSGVGCTIILIIIIIIILTIIIIYKKHPGAFQRIQRFRSPDRIVTTIMQS